ncbi:MAG: GNAT family N-acetyltransferase [Oscillospiraceae bacterium]|jgi:mannose-6-phosphate isomerase-like protein (cupin superfamily)|nr:GNAT family N-acetyltransferase [Oscillospiraceae bacterium]
MNPKAINLRTYDASMQPAIKLLYTRCFRVLGWDFDLQNRHADLANIPDEYQKTGQFWCLYDGETLVGTVAIRNIDTVGRVAEMKRLYVDPDRQGEGFGKLLFETALQYARDSGFKKICADTRQDRSASRHLMESHGFHAVPQYNDNDFAEMFFELELQNTALRKVNLKESANALQQLGTYTRVGTLNGNMLNVVAVENRTLDFHVHEASDELFYVIEGRFWLETEDGLTEMNEGELIIVPKGTRHRPVVTTLVKCLLIELDGTLNAQNTGT